MTECVVDVNGVKKWYQNGKPIGLMVLQPNMQMAINIGT